MRHHLRHRLQVGLVPLEVLKRLDQPGVRYFKNIQWTTKVLETSRFHILRSTATRENHISVIYKPTLRITHAKNKRNKVQNAFSCNFPKMK